KLLHRNRFCIVTALLCFSISFCAVAAAGQTSPAAAQNSAANNTEATIDVAVVRLHPAAVMHNNFRFSRNRFELEDQPMMKLIAFAYSLNPRQIVGAPG